MRNTDSIFLYPTTQAEVTKLIHNLDTNKATGMDTTGQSQYCQPSTK